MNLRYLQLSNFRNHKETNLSFPTSGAIFEGINGSGKTNLLESIYLLCTGRSQRGAKRTDMISFGAEHSYIEGSFVDSDGGIKTASMGFSRDKNLVMRLDGNHVQSFSDWFGHRPIVSFGSEDLLLISGSPEHRRRFLDITGSQVDNGYLRALISYRHWLSCRNRILGENIDIIQCETYEEKMAETGAEIFIRRKEILTEISRHFSGFYEEISGKREKAELCYEPGIKCDSVSKNEWKNVFYYMLSEHRRKDIQTGYTTIGPHRDDICFLIENKPAKTFGSQGQCRSIVLALKLSSVNCVEKYRKERMIFLIDDALSELDSIRTSMVFPLVEKRGQVFIAAPRINVPVSSDFLRCVVSEGKVMVS